MVNLSTVLTDMVKAIVDQPEAVAVTESEVNGETVLELTVAPDDMGKVIGKHGRIARALRMLMKAAATSVDRKVVVKIR
ncbi:MAG: KH domain-containing protein [Clostridia bacterium]|nr:KH domain-containing protein [Clostridia bacterium]MCQ2432835.1 KH domain-containing protein [Clostridia bacterium]